MVGISVVFPNDPRADQKLGVSADHWHHERVLYCGWLVQEKIKFKIQSMVLAGQKWPPGQNVYRCCNIVKSKN